MKRSMLRLRLVLKNYRHQILITFISTLLLFAYNNCGKLASPKTKKSSTKTSALSDQMIAVGNPTGLLPRPGPKTPLVYFGDGRIVDNKHTVFPNLPNVAGYTPSGWQLDQTPGRELIHPDHLSLNDPLYDSLLGKANWVFSAKGGGSHLKIFNNSQYGMVYELFSKNGNVGPYGGTGLILTPSELLPVQKITGKIKLDLDFRLSKVISSNSGVNPSFHWFVLSGMYFQVKNPETGALKSFLIQIIHGNHKAISEATNYKFDNGVDSPMLGGIINSDLDKVFVAEMADFKHITLDINKYMCYATKQKYGSASGKVFTMPSYFRNPKNWSFSGYFFDLEHASQTCTDPNPVYGESCPDKYIKDFGDKLEIGVQVANIKMTQQAMENYHDICQDYSEDNQLVAPTAKIYIDKIANASKTIFLDESIDLNYESTNTSSCTLTATLNGKTLYQNVDLPPNNSLGKISFKALGNYKWEVLCKNANSQTALSQASLNVINRAEVATSPITTTLPTARFYIDAQLNGSKTINPGEKVDLKYESSNALSCTLTAYMNGNLWYKNVDFLPSHNWGKVQFDTNGVTYRWEIDCKNNQGKVASSAVSLKVDSQYNVSKAAFYINNIINPNSSIKVGESIELRYEASSMDTCTLTAYLNGTLWYQNIDFTNSHNWGKTLFNSVGTYRWVIDCKNNKGQTATATGSLNVKN